MKVDMTDMLLIIGFGLLLILFSNSVFELSRCWGLFSGGLQRPSVSMPRKSGSDFASTKP